MGVHPKYKAIMLAPRGKIANEHILYYWKDYIKIIRSSVSCFVLKPLTNNRFTTYDVHRYVSPINRGASFPKIETRYFETGGRPLLTLKDVDRQRGWQKLSDFGMPADVWFVCVHCREEGYVSGEGQTYRNADISSYMPAIEAIIDRGGWVIRLGDPSMKKIPKNKYIIDYAHLDDKSDWMDVFLCGACKFFLGSASGLAMVSSAFGVPSAIANQAPVSVVLPFSPFDIGIPKLLYSQKEKRYLKFSEILNSPIGNFRFDSLYKDCDVCVINNTPEIIEALALEMLDRINGAIVYTSEDNELQKRFKSLMDENHYSYGSLARVGRDFLRKYSFLLDR